MNGTPTPHDPLARRTCRIRVGTSGYSYPEWADGGGFYPAGKRTGDMLPVYAATFPVTELNYTWYQMPKARALEGMCLRIPPRFCFAAKLTRTLTHEIDPDHWRGQVDRYRDGIAPLIQSGCLLAVLAQFPASFRRTPENRRYLAELLDELGGLPTAVEFRHVSWAVDPVYAELQQRGVTLVSVDAPDLAWLFPKLAVVTNPALFYVRFHGRNPSGWPSGNMQKQFDYDYTAAELQEWSDGRLLQMAENAREGVVFFNNHVRAQAPANARKLMQLLARQGLQ
jgi:uncharacterized protein YecE (DUF72 family)